MTTEALRWRLRPRLAAVAVLVLATVLAVVWREPSLPGALALILLAQAAAAALLWRPFVRALAERGPTGAGEVALARDAERLVATLAAVRSGDLGVRAALEGGPLLPAGQALDATLDAACGLVRKLAGAAGDVSVAAEAIERLTRVLAERSGRQTTAIAEVARKLKGMGARSEEIGQIVELLDDVAAETNVLALNAALEASRAGTQGKGFGMVADEVRKLAERSATATRDIGAFIQGIEATTFDTGRSVEEIRALTEGLAGSAGQTAGAAASLLGAARLVAGSLLRLRIPGQDESDLARALRERRSEIARALEPITPLLDGARTPLGDALKQLLVVLADGGPRPPGAALGSSPGAGFGCSLGSSAPVAGAAPPALPGAVGVTRGIATGGMPMGAAGPGSTGAGSTGAGPALPPSPAAGTG